MGKGEGGSCTAGETRELRVAVFLDAPNLYRGTKGNGVSIDPSEVLEHSRSFGRLAVAVAYLALKDGLPVDYLARTYSEAGYSVRFVPPTFNTKDVDTTMVADIVQASYEDHADVFVVVTGDTDFVPALEIARRQGKRVVVLAFPDSCGEALRRRADVFVALPIRAVASAGIAMVVA